MIQYYVSHRCRCVPLLLFIAYIGTTARVRPRSPVKARWIKTLILQEISVTPNITNKHMKHILSLYVKEKFLTVNILQSARSQARFHLFGDPTQNVQYVNALHDEMVGQGHNVNIVQHTAMHVIMMLEKMMLQEEIDRQKSNNVKMSGQQKLDYIVKWRKMNSTMLKDGGLGPPDPGSPRHKFLTGIFFSPKYTKDAVPYLQQVFQGDACHLHFGKYTLYSLYGTTANCNTFPIAFGISFGNECKEGWTEFFMMVKQWYPTLNVYTTTVISDQAKGLTESIRTVMDAVGQFRCSYHRRQNIRSVVWGGTGQYSCLWMYNKLMGATNMEQFNEMKATNFQHVADNALKYLNSINDTEQYPCVRVNMGEGIYMYQRSASSSVESMNNANNAVRARTAVDPVNATMLLLQKENERFMSRMAQAHEWMEELTPHGIKLRDDIFKKVEFRDYYISIVNGEDRVDCTVSRLGGVSRKCYFLVNPNMGSNFGGCTCGAPNVNGVPCHHMIAVVKSSRVEGLTSNNAMPNWWTTQMWRKQYPKWNGHEILNNSSLTSNHTPEPIWRYCPPYAAPSKPGRPKIPKRFKSPLEQMKKKKAKVGEHKMSESKKSSKDGKLKKAE